MFVYQCAKCSQERLRTHHYTASLNDNTRCDINTDNTRGDTNTYNTRRDINTDNSRGDSNTDNIRRDMNTDNSRRDTNTDNSRGDINTDISRCDINTDNTRRDINTATSRTQDTDCNPVKPTQLPGIHTFFISRYPFYIDECDSSVKANLKCDKNIKSTINGSTTEGSTLVELIKNQDSLNIDIAANSSRPASKKNDVCRTCHESFSKKVDVHKLIYTGEKSSSSIHTGEKSSSSIHNGEKSSSRINTDEKSSSRIHTAEKLSSIIHTGEKPSPCTEWDG